MYSIASVFIGIACLCKNIICCSGSKFFRQFEITVVTTVFIVKEHIIGIIQDFYTRLHSVVRRIKSICRCLCWCEFKNGKRLFFGHTDLTVIPGFDRLRSTIIQIVNYKFGCFRIAIAVFNIAFKYVFLCNRFRFV